MLSYSNGAVLCVCLSVHFQLGNYVLDRFDHIECFQTVQIVVQPSNNWSPAGVEDAVSAAGVEDAVSSSAVEDAVTADAAASMEEWDNLFVSFVTVYLPLKTNWLRIKALLVRTDVQEPYMHKTGEIVPWLMEPVSRCSMFLTIITNALCKYRK